MISTILTIVISMLVIIIISVIVIAITEWDEITFIAWLDKKNIKKGDIVTVNFHRSEKYQIKEGYYNWNSNYSDYYKNKDIYGEKAKVISTEYGYFMFELIDEKFEDREITISKNFIRENKNCIISGSKKLQIKKRMPKIFRFALYAGVVTMFWKLVNNVDTIVVFLVNHIIK